MLGSVRHKHVWEWSVMGKHPAAMDYFQLGSKAPLVSAFAGWIENGYQKLLSRKRSGSTFCSWRFWAKGIRKGYIACGVGRDSSDRAGRPYPLMIIGVGTLPGWEKNWHLLTYAFEDIWKQIEYVTSGRVADIKQLETDIGRIKLPSRQWPSVADSRLKDSRRENGPGKHVMPDRGQEIEKRAGMLLANNELFASIDGDQNGDSLAMAGYWMQFLTSRTDIVPNAVFLGGVPEKPYLAIFNRSLKVGDFVRLWSAPIAD